LKKKKKNVDELGPQVLGHVRNWNVKKGGPIGPL